jgi:phosphoribosylaminoimidazole carboxylase PurE protein
MLYASAHKTPLYLLSCIETLERKYVKESRVYITIAGLSNGLSGLVDAAVQVPVIACPPIDVNNALTPYDLFSSLRMPSGVAPAVVLNPLNAALLSAKILGKYKNVQRFQIKQKDELITANT